MAETRANSTDGLDLHLAVDGTRPTRALESALREAVRSGRLRPGSRLPSSRDLAADLGVARNSVADAYGQLTAEGWLEARVGAGTWVSARVPGDEPGAASAAPPPRRIELRGGIPDASAFPRARWSAAARRALASVPTAGFGYPDPLGSPALRSVLAEYLARTRGVETAPERIVVTRGFGDLLATAARALRRGGARRIAVEAYGHAQHRRILRAAGLEPVPLAVDDAGADTRRLGELGVSAVLLTAAHQFPVGVPLSPERRLAAVEWARAHAAIVIEDDYDGEFRYDRRAIGALQALAPDVVLYAGTASKALAPAVGLGWGAVPPAFLPALRAERTAGAGTADVLNQLALAEFMDAHDYDRQVRRRRAAYRERRSRLVRALADGAPGARVTGLAAGLQCLVRLPPGSSEAAVEAAAERLGVRVQGLTAFAAEPVEPVEPAEPAEPAESTPGGRGTGDRRRLRRAGRARVRHGARGARRGDPGGYPRALSDRGTDDFPRKK